MNILQQITETLKLMGATPETVTRPDGTTEIKVNAPIISGNGGTNEKAEN